MRRGEGGENAPDGVLSTPLLEKEDAKGNDEADEVALAKEGFMESKACTSDALFFDSGLDLNHFSENVLRILRLLAEVCKVGDGCFVPADGGEPTRRFLERTR